MRISHLLLFLTLGAFYACDKDDNDPVCSLEFAAGTRFFEFKSMATGSTFVAWTADTAVVNSVLTQLALPQAQRGQHINGKILRKPAGCTTANQPWSWYFDPTDWALAELSIEVCDGTPEYVEEHLAEYVDNVGRYCPWSSVAVREVSEP